MKKLFLILALASFAFAQSPAAIPLTKEESEQAVRLAQEYQKSTVAVQQAVVAVIAAPLEDCAKITAAVGNLKLAVERSKIPEAVVIANLETLRDKYKCKECLFADDYKALVKPKAVP